MLRFGTPKKVLLGDRAWFEPPRTLDGELDFCSTLFESSSSGGRAIAALALSMRWKCRIKDIGKERYQIEIPVDAIKRKKEGVPKEWILMSQTKSVKRFHTPTITSLLKPLAEAEYTVEVRFSIFLSFFLLYFKLIIIYILGTKERDIKRIAKQVQRAQ